MNVLIEQAKKQKTKQKLELYSLTALMAEPQACKIAES